MKLIKAAAAVINQTPLDWEGNQDRVARVIRAAREQQVTLLCLPELCLTGYGCEDAFLAPALQETALAVLRELLPETRGLLVSLGLPLRYRGGIYNTACLAADGDIVGFVGKQYLAGEGLHYEPRWFKPWPNDTRVDVEIAGREYPLGDLMFSVDGVLIGFEICEDAWVAQRPGAELARRGVDIILNPSASHFAFGKHDIRARFVLEGSRAFNVSYLYANLMGNEAGRAIYDGDAMLAMGGEMLAMGPRFSFADFSLTTAVIDVDLTRMRQARTASYRPTLDRQTDNLVTAPFVFPDIPPEANRLAPAAWELVDNRKEEEFTRAMALALFDYLRKSRSHGLVVSLSGGADSSAVAVLSALMLDLGAAELGFEGLLRRLDYIPGAAACGSPRALTRRLLTTAYQATRNSGPITRGAARAVAEALGADHFEFDVDAQAQGYVDLVGAALGRPLTWEQDDIALQNIQARARAPGVWMLANIRQALLLATSNRSEAAVGYATMDGDTSGGLSPIAGIDKAFLRHWLRWMETVGPAGLGPLPALAAVNAQQPTAELRPSAANQTDEADLMPYELLDAIERAAIRDKCMPLEVFRLMERRFPRYTRAQLLTWVERFFKLWSRNQWKRERYAPSFHLDDENLDPKTWCRFPILSGGFERELRELRAWLAKRPPGPATPRHPPLAE